MIVHNNGTRDGRVMREAHALQHAGHMVTVVGIPETGATKAEESLPDGVRVIRVPHERSRAFRVVILGAALAVLAAALGYALFRLYRIAAAGNAVAWGGPFGASRNLAGSSASLLIFIIVLLAMVYVLRYVIARARDYATRRERKRELVRRQLISETSEGPLTVFFPAIRSRIPSWIPDWLLEILTAPLAILGVRFPSFSSYRHRSRMLASAAIGFDPDVVHCHDCSALPTGWLVKKALGIPLVYDAHEIYEAVASRRFGATDYFARVHARYLPHVDGFVAVNDSAANYYRYSYPTAPRATVIRNATEYTPAGTYDGRLHRAAGLPAQQKIILYQGGFTKHRGLETLVRAALLLSDDWSVVMMGKGPLLETLKGIPSAGKASFVSAVPADELLSWTQGATVGIIPYEDTVLNHWIATPNKLWEYPNAGVPMIVQPFAELRRVVETYGCGWVLPQAFSAEAIANLVASLTPEMIEQAQAGCRRFIEADNWTVYRRRLLELYGKLEEQVSDRNVSAELQATI
ncbi:MAG TPA: glycosyltransferase [Rhizomicrobium sp.]|nr:glycosyltransferase [Rhizomicrobium sp.]